ncbi:MAG: hypothetical protein M3O32_00410 [Actinomycetota bacterium]|nr:hypothetical protein [Actinomycetota bacterium]
MAFDAATKLQVLDALIGAGVRWIEVGIPAMGGDELTYLKAATERQSQATLVAWNRGVRADVEQSLDLGFLAVHIGLPASQLHLAESVGKTRKWLLATVRDLVALAKDRGAFVSVSAEDIARTEISFLEEYAGVVHESGADRLRLSDTVGLLGPEGYGERIRAAVAAAPVDVQCHAHNDFGLGLANTLAGLQAGARYFHVTINGMGERAGMADLAQAVMALKYLYGVDLGVKTEQLTALSQLVAKACRAPVQPWQPIVGPNISAHESGIHVNAMLKDTSTFEPFAPEVVGAERSYVLGKHSGRALVEAVLRASGAEPSAQDLTRSLAWVREQSNLRGGRVPEAELVTFFEPFKVLK